MKKGFLALCALSLAFVGCDNNDDAVVITTEGTIGGVVSNTPDLSSLDAALIRTGLDQTLRSQSSSFTVFAPSNAAFASFLAANNFSSLEDVPVDLLTNVLLNHVIGGPFISTNLTTNYYSSLSPAGADGRNLSLYVNNTGTSVTVNGSVNVTQADIATTNGVVHLVDAVIGLPDIVDQAVANPNLTSLVGALTSGGNTTFTDLLSDESQTFTVFAPVNDAFSAFTNPNGNDLNSILSYHVIGGTAAFSDQLNTGYVTTAAVNADGDFLSQYISTASGVTINGTSNVAAADIVATNGVIHAVDGVIDLPSVVTFAAADPTFQPLVEALTTGTPATDFPAVLSGDGPFTVFAPTNDAFANLLTALSVGGVSEIDEGLLTAVLNHHVVSGNVRSGDLTDGIMPVTLEGDMITINLPGTGGAIADITDGSGNTGIGITVVDVQANNGVIHVVDQVLIPDTDDGSITSLVNNNADLSSLRAALARADLLNTLRSTASDFTVFAPTNAAFSQFLSDNGFATVDDVPVDVLTQVLLNHVIDGELTSGALATQYYSSLSTAGADGRNLSLFVDTAGGVTVNGVASVAQPDVDATNGVVHVVDAVIGLPDVVDHAVANPALTSLVGALTAGGNTTFTTLLSDDSETFTVFAPVNDAFTAFTNPNGNDLDNILSYHVISGTAAFSDELSTTYVNTLGTNADGDFLSQYISTASGVTINGSSNVAVADVVATNGVIHAVDGVIDLPSVVTFAVADPTFAPLVEALTTATPATDFVSVLSGNGPFTVFAPTDDAFQNLFTALSVNGVDEIEEGLLTSVLNHHVVNGNVRSGDLTDGIMPETLEGDMITINLPGTGDNIADVTDGSGNAGIGIDAVDVQALNGVIHVLDAVLLPDTTN